MTRRAHTLGVLLAAAALVAACGGDKKEPDGVGNNGTGTPPVVSIDAAAAESPPPADPYACTSDDDCVISCEIAGDCCGEACQCDRPYHRDQEDAIRAANRDKCSVIDMECPQYDCDMPSEDIVPVCVDGACSAKRVPR